MLFGYSLTLRRKHRTRV